jgi:hypothetical protein
VSRRVAFLGLSVVVLLAARGWLALTERRVSDGVGAPLIVVEQARIQGLELVRGDARVRIERRGEGWVLPEQGGLAADPERVQALVSRLCGWRRERRAGADPAQHSVYGVDAVGARRIRLLGGKDHTGQEPVLAEVWVGKISGVAADLLREKNDQIDTETLGVFVRARDAREALEEPGPVTWVVNDFLGNLADPAPRRWIESPLLPGRPQEVTRVEVTSPGGRRAYRFAPQIEVEGETRPLDRNRVRGSLGSLYLLRGLGPAPSVAPSDAIRLQIQGGRATALVSLWSQGERWFLSRPGLAPGRPGAGVEVSAEDAARVARLGDVGTLLRRRVFMFPLERATRVHWRSAEVERSWLRGSGVWDAIQTGARLPLRSRSVPNASLVPLWQRLAGLEAETWTPGALSAEERVAEWVLQGAWGRLEVAVGAAREGRRPLSCSDQPGHLAWVVEEELREIEAALVRLWGE